MQKHSLLAAAVATLMLVACGVQTADDSTDPSSPEAPVQFGGVQGDSGSAAESGVPCTTDGGTTAADSGSPKTDSGTSQNDSGDSATDGGSDATDSGSPAVDSGKADSGPADAGTDATDSGSPVVDSGTDSGTPDSGCGCPPKDAGTDSGPVVDSGVVVPDNTDVVRLSADHKTFLFSTRYIFSASCGEVRGPMPGVGWTAGPQSCDTDNDGYFAYTPIAGTVGTFAFTYLDPSKPADGWALYGNIDTLRSMTPTARSFVECTWWDASTQKTVQVAGGGSCSLKATFGSGGTLVGAGNMANLL